MARLPVSPDALVAQYGPRLGFPPKEGFPGRDEPDRVVPTHCCFCGMQCGIKLLVKDNRIVTVDRRELDLPRGRRIRRGEATYAYKRDRCLRCGTPIQAVELAGRPCYFCPTCQPV